MEQIKIYPVLVFFSLLHVGLLGLTSQFLLVADVGKTSSTVSIPKEIRFKAQFKRIIKELICYFHRTDVFTAISFTQCASETSQFLKIKPMLRMCGSSCHIGSALYVF